MKFIKEEQQEKYSEILDKLATTATVASAKLIKDFKLKSVNEKESEIIGITAADMIIDKNLKMLKELSREELELFFIQCGTMYALDRVNQEPGYGAYIMLRAKLEM